MEQQFGNFQNLDAIKVAKRERWQYGTFFFRFPDGESHPPSSVHPLNPDFLILGESGLDVYTRITDFIATMHRDFSNDNIMRDGNVNMIVVTHGLALRLFLMRWFLVRIVHATIESPPDIYFPCVQYTVQDFEQTINPTNGGYVMMERQVDSEVSALYSGSHFSSSV